MGSKWSNVSLDGKLRLWSDYAHAQTHLNLRSTHMAFYTLCWIPAAVDNAAGPGHGMRICDPRRLRIKPTQRDWAISVYAIHMDIKLATPCVRAQNDDPIQKHEMSHEMRHILHWPFSYLEMSFEITSTPKSECMQHK